MIFGQRRRLNKKAQIGDIAVYIGTIAIICITLILARFIFVKVQTQINDSPFVTPEASKVFTDFDPAFAMFDQAMIFIVVGLTIGLVITSFLIPAHPVFLVINIVGLVGLTFLAGVMSNIYGKIINIPEIASVLSNTTSTDFMKTATIMENLPWICVFVVFISTVVLYSKSRPPQ